jgi:UDP-glucose 4-epimerase
MKAVVTGGAGFIGSHLVEYLLQRRWEVVVLDDLSTGMEGNLPDVETNQGLHIIRGSICSKDTVDDCVAGADAIFHLAAAVGTFTIRDNPIGSLTTNVHGTETILEAARRHQVPILVASTSEIYGMNPKAGLTENDLRIIGSPIQSRWSYSDAKAIDETLARAYYLEYGVKSVIVRLFNTVGPRQTGRYGMVIPRFVSQALSGSPVTVYGDGRQVRCFCHVLDVVPALTDLLESSEAHGEVYNLGSSEPISVIDLAQRIIAATGSTSDVQYVPYEKAHYAGYQDVERRIPACDKAKACVGFSPTRSLDDIIDDVIQHQVNRPGMLTRPTHATSVEPQEV